MKFLPATIIFLLVHSVVFAQLSKLNQRYPGYFINAKNDTIHGYILMINELENQDLGEYSNDAKGEKIKIALEPDEVTGYKVQDRIYTSVEYGDPDPQPQHFLLTLAEGELKLYQYFNLEEGLYVASGNGNRPATGDDEQYLQSVFVIVNKSGKQFTIDSENGLLKNAKEIFTGDDLLLNKITDKQKDFRYTDLTELVKQYNLSVQ